MIIGEQPQEPLPDSISPLLSIASRIIELERCEDILDEILATFSLETNKQTAKDNPQFFIQQTFLLFDSWKITRAASKPKSK